MIMTLLVTSSRLVNLWCFCWIPLRLPGPILLGILVPGISSPNHVCQSYTIQSLEIWSLTGQPRSRSMKFQGQGRVIQTQFLVEGMNLLSVEPTKGVSFAFSYSKERFPCQNKRLFWTDFIYFHSDFPFKSPFRMRLPYFLHINTPNQRHSINLAWLASSRVGSSTKAPGPMSLPTFWRKPFPSRPTNNFHEFDSSTFYISIRWPNLTDVWQAWKQNGLIHFRVYMNATHFWCRTRRDCWIPRNSDKNLQVAMMYYLDLLGWWHPS